MSNQRIITEYNKIEEEICAFFNITREVQQSKSSGYDGIGVDGSKYEIKCEFGDFPHSTFLEFLTCRQKPTPVSYPSGIQRALRQADFYILVKIDRVYVIKTRILGQLIAEYSCTWSQRTTRRGINGNSFGFSTIGWIVPIAHIEGLADSVFPTQVLTAASPSLQAKFEQKKLAARAAGVAEQVF